APTDDGVAALPASALQQIDALIAEKAARTPEQRKIASALLYAKSGRFAALAPHKGTDKNNQLRSLMEYDAIGRVLIDVKGNVGAGIPARISALGGQVVTTSVTHGSVRAWLALERMETLAADPNVTAVRQGFMATTWRHDSPRGHAEKTTFAT